LKNIFKFIVTIILVGVIVWKLGGIGQVGTLLAGISPIYILFIFVLHTLDRALMVFKWGRLLKSRGIHLPFFQGMKIYCASMIWGLFLPSTVGADAIRAYSTSRSGFDSNEVVASIILERLIGFLSALILGLLSYFLFSHIGTPDNRFKFIWWAGGILLFCAAIGFATSFSQWAFDFLHGRLFGRFRDTPVMQRLQQFHSTYLSYKNDRKSLVVFFGMTFGEQLVPILDSWLIARGLGIEVGIAFIAGAVPLAMLVSRLPISIDGIGVFEGVFIVLMSFAGVSASEAVAISLVGRVLQTVSWLPWWVAYVSNNGAIKPPQILRIRT
jgi:glycosyltransferase 2 family protein